MNWVIIGSGNGLSPVWRQTLPEAMLACCQLDSRELISVKFESEFYHYHSRKCNSKCCLPKWQPFCPGEMSWSHSAGTLNSMLVYLILVCKICPCCWYLWSQYRLLSHSKIPCSLLYYELEVYWSMTQPWKWRKTHIKNAPANVHN